MHISSSRLYNNLMMFIQKSSLLVSGVTTVLCALTTLQTASHPEPLHGCCLCHIPSFGTENSLDLFLVQLRGVITVTAAAVSKSDSEAEEKKLLICFFKIPPI